jgi:predicted glycosyltransferase
VRIAIYSHDAVGLENIRRTLGICKHWNQSFAEASILIVTGSLHTLQLVGEAAG